MNQSARGSGRVPFYFAIPLRPRARSRHWDRVIAHLQATVDSCLNQTDPDFRILVACTEVPDLRPDPRLELLPLPPDQRAATPMLDKGLKLSAIGMRVRQAGGGFVMPVDADDLVHRRVVEHVRSHPQADAFIGDWGYDLDRRRRRLIPAPRFDRSCGTCAALRLAPEQLPATLDEPDPEARFLIRAGHHNWRPRLAAAGARVLGFPFPVAVHVLHTGDNESLRTGDVGWKRRLLRRLMPAHALTAERVRDYGIDALPALPAARR